MKEKFDIIGRIMQALESFSVSYAFVIIIYILISNFGVFSPLDNRRAVQLMWICLVIAALHFVMGFFVTQMNAAVFVIYFAAVAAVVLFMGIFVYDFFTLNASFLVCLAVMLLVVFAGTYLVAYFDDLKKVQEINELIRRNKK